MNGTINKLKSNPFYIPNDRESEEIWKAEQLERVESEKALTFEVPEVNDNSFEVHEIKIKRKRKYEKAKK